MREKLKDAKDYIFQPNNAKTIGLNEEEKDETIKRYELSYNTKKLNELLDEVIILMNKIKSLN